MITFQPVSTLPEMLVRYESLFETCFSKHPKFGLEVLRWLYVGNPEGPAVGFDAWDGDVLAAHYVCIPTRVRIRGEEVRSLLSLNTATHPGYQGQGLFPKLAALTFEAATVDGFHSAYGVANANSSPAAVKKLGYRLVAPLQAMVGVGSLGFDLQEVSRRAGFERVWTAQALQWRCANPVNPVRLSLNGDRLLFHAKAMGMLVSAVAELPILQDGLAQQQGRVWSPLRLHLGLLPDGVGGLGRYFDIPRRLRPSPLNLMYRPLSATGSAIDAGRVHFNFLDFDAY
jgi:hypothetical protein